MYTHLLTYYHRLGVYRLCFDRFLDVFTPNDIEHTDRRTGQQEMVVSSAGTNNCSQAFHALIPTINFGFIP